MALGDVLNEYLISHKLSMGKFAEKSKISKAYISMLIKNENPRTGEKIAPSLTTYKKCAKAMGISVDKLIDKSGDDSLFDLTDEIENHVLVILLLKALCIIYYTTDFSL